MSTTDKDGRVMLGLLMFGVTGGSAFIFVKHLVGETTPLQVVTGRVTMAAVPLLAIMFIAGSAPRLSGRFLAKMAVLAAVDTVVPYLLISWAQLRISSSTAALLVSTMPLFSTLIAAWTSEGRPLTASTLVGLGFGFAGVAVLAGPGAYGSGSTVGMLAVIVASLCYALGAAYSRSLMRYADPLGLSAVKLAVAAVFLLPVTAFTDGLGGFASLSLVGWLALFEVGFISTGIGRWVYQWVIAKAGSVRASLVTYLVPLVAVFLGWAVLGEPIGPQKLAGAVLVLGGISAVLYGPQLAARLAQASSLALPVLAFRGRGEPRCVDCPP